MVICNHPWEHPGVHKPAFLARLHIDEVRLTQPSVHISHGVVQPVGLAVVRVYAGMRVPKEIEKDHDIYSI